MKTEQLKKELEWWRTYGEYVAKVHNNVDAEACGFADGDEEYLDNVETEYKGPFDKRLLQELNNIL